MQLGARVGRAFEGLGFTSPVLDHALVSERLSAFFPPDDYPTKSCLGWKGAVGLMSQVGASPEISEPGVTVFELRHADRETARATDDYVLRAPRHGHTKSTTNAFHHLANTRLELDRRKHPLPAAPAIQLERFATPQKRTP